MRSTPKLAAVAASLLTLAMPVVEAHAQAPSSGAEQPAERAGLRINVELVVDTLPESAQAKASAELERQLAELAEEHDLVVVERDAATLFIRLELNQPDKTVDVFLVDVVAVYADDLPRQNAQACIQCAPAEMVHDGLERPWRPRSEAESRRAKACSSTRTRARSTPLRASAKPWATPGSRAA